MRVLASAWLGLLLVFRLGAFKKRAESGRVGAQRQWDVLSETLAWSEGFAGWLKNIF
jgi:hypothetical protein